MVVKVVTPNQGFVLSRLQREPSLFLLFTNMESMIGRQVMSVMESKYHVHDSLYMVHASHITTGFSDEDLFYLRKLGVTVLPELRRYRNGKLDNTWRGLDQLALMA